MRIIKKEDIRTSLPDGVILGTELVDVRTGEQLDAQQRELLRTTLERNLLRRNVGKLEKRTAILEQEITTADERIETERQAAHATGLQEGIEKGLRQSQAEAEELALSMRDLMSEARLQRRELVTNTGSQVVDLILEVARQLVGEVFQLQPELLAGVIDKLLDEYANSAPFTISLHPDDLAILKRKGYLEQLEKIKTEFIEAPEVPRHQCRVEMAQGLVELGEQQFSVIRKALIEQLEVDNRE